MIEGSVEKQPSETFLVGLDFASVLESEETITSQTVTSKNAVTGADSSSTFLSGIPAVDGSIVTQRILAGSDGDVHIVQFRIGTSAANTYESELIASVREH